MIFPRKLTRPGWLALVVALLLAPVTTAPAAVADATVTVTGSVKGAAAAPVPLAGVALTVWAWRDQDNEWEGILGSGNSEVTDEGGTFTLELEAETSYSLGFTAPDGAYPPQYLGGGPSLPESPTAADWDPATFVPAELTAPLTITLHKHATFSGSGFVQGDEDALGLGGYVELYEVDEGGVAHVEDFVDSADLDPQGGFVFHGMTAGRRYTALVHEPGYLPTYLGDTTHPELAASLTVGAANPVFPDITLRRGAAVTGTVTSGDLAADLVHVTPKRWDPAGARWLDLEHFDGLTTDTLPDGSWERVLEPGVRYTLFFDTDDVESTTGPVPASQYLGGGTAPPSPSDTVATFHLLDSGEEVSWELVPPPIEAVSYPLVTGAPRLGARLTGTLGVWGVADVTLKRQWLRNGAIIPGATGASYTPVAADLGRRISLRVTASRARYATAVVTTPGTAPVARATSTTSLTLSRSSAKYGSGVRATVTVRASAGSPTGVVRLSLDGKVIASKIPVVSGTKGSATFELPRGIKTGTHRLAAATAQSATVLASSSATSKLTTTKASVRLKVKGPKKWRVKRGKRPKVTITVVGTKGGPTPTGKITVKFGKKKVTKALKRGKVTLNGPKLKKRGKVTVKITYAPKAKTYAKPKTVKKTLQVR